MTGHGHHKVLPERERFLDKFLAVVASTKERPSILACGRSGLLLAGQISTVADVDVCVIRKPGEIAINYTTGILPAYGCMSHKCNVFVDDLISSGRTLYRAYLCARARDTVIHHLLLNRLGLSFGYDNGIQRLFSNMYGLQTITDNEETHHRPAHVTLAPNAVHAPHPNRADWDTPPSSWIYP